jgi:2-polyprenyl-3-methyl-5-hydroxy-6-metoxy-1,4-benzoquinol methylase
MNGQRWVVADPSAVGAYNPLMLLDPENNETRALFRLFDDFAGRSVLEVGCGDGRLTWRYAARAASVTAIDPDSSRIARALAARPDGLEHISFLALALEDFAARAKERFDIAILAWSL